MNHVMKVYSASDVLRHIVHLQFSGELQEAHDAYVEFFQSNDVDYNALNLFGLCCDALGKLEKAERIFEHVSREAPFISEARLHLANCRFQQGKMELALAALRQTEADDLELSETQIMLARIHMALGRDDKAKEALSKALELDPKREEALLALAGIHHALGELTDALNLYKKVLFNDPNHCDALIGQAEIYTDRETWDAVLVNTGIVLEQFPADLRAGHLQAKALEKLGRNDDLLETACNMSKYAPDDIEVLKLLCLAYSQVGDFPSCIFVSSQALAIEPDCLAPMTLRANAYFKLGFVEIALMRIDEVLQRFPNDIQALRNKGVILERLCRIDEAIAIYDRILEQKPDEATTRFNKSMCLLLQGCYEEGFSLYESRFNRETNLLPNYCGDEPIWSGESLAGRHLLIHPEQGFGDTIMASRFIKLLDDTGAKLTFAVPKALRSVMETLDMEARIITVGEHVDKIDFHVPLMSLPHLTSAQWQEIPATEHYLHAPEAKTKEWQERLGHTDGFRVGFVCSGNPEHANDFARSINMGSFLKSLPAGPEYHLLQKDLRPTDEAALARRRDIATHHQVIGDFADTAALCQCMDLVVSVDTSVAHLAGALGCSTLLMLPEWPDWRWGLGRVNDVWYPNTRIVRQVKAKEWQSVLDYVSHLIIQKMNDKTAKIAL